MDDFLICSDCKRSTKKNVFMELTFCVTYIIIRVYCIHRYLITLQPPPTVDYKL